MTPGQACVFYDGDQVLGGADIAGATPARAPVRGAGVSAAQPVTT